MKKPTLVQYKEYLKETKANIKGWEAEKRDMQLVIKDASKMVRFVEGKIENF